MKRSEMIDILVHDMVGEYSWDGLKIKISLEYAYGIAENMLKLIEKKGMLPPPIKNPRIPKEMDRVEWATNKALEKTYHYQHLPESFEINMWEDENETL